MRLLAASLGALALMAGCSTVELVRDTPSPELTRDCPHPEVDTRTNGGLAQGIKAYRASLTLCNIDKASLREWAKE